MTETADPYLVQRRAEILEAARAVFVRRGFEGARIQEIADEAGISAGAIYRYFPSKESLVTTVCAAAGADYMSMFDMAGDRSAFEILAEGGEQVWQLAFGPTADEAVRMNLEATLAALRHPEEIGERFAGEMAAEVDQLAELVARAQVEGSFSREIDARTLAATLLAVTQGMQVLNAQLRGDVDIDAAWRLLLRMLGGLRPAEQDTRQDSA